MCMLLSSLSFCCFSRMRRQEGQLERRKQVCAKGKRKGVFVIPLACLFPRNSHFPLSSLFFVCGSDSLVATGERGSVQVD
mmetsp:Transcript_40058/g.78974  ORF Transcript_40058/g.78974 Transcript_40058/m.78974 type:complete len:80 (+) Transcript_40058:240-479(+)